MGEQVQGHPGSWSAEPSMCPVSTPSLPAEHRLEEDDFVHPVLGVVIK